MTKPNSSPKEPDYKKEYLKLSNLVAEFILYDQGEKMGNKKEHCRAQKEQLLKQMEIHVMNIKPHL